MLTLTLNNRPIPLPVDFSMRLTWKSPVCDFEKIPGSYGLGLSFPINPFTKALFGNPHRFAKHRANNDQKFPSFEIRFKGVLLMAGTLSIQSSAKGNYEGTVIDQTGVLGEKEQERSILDIQKFAEEIEWVNSANYDPDIHPYCCFQLGDSTFFKDKGVMVSRTTTVPDPDRGGTKKIDWEDEVLTFLFNKTAYGIVNLLKDDRTITKIASTIDIQKLEQKGNSYETGKVTVISPFFFLNYVIKNALKDSFIHLGQNYIQESPALKNLCIYNNFDITETELWIAEVTYTEILQGPNSEYAEDGIIANWGPNVISAGKRVVQYNRKYPSINLGDFNEIYFENYTYPKNHLPKISVGELLLSTQNLVNVCFHFLMNNTVNVFSRDEILLSQATDLDKYFVGQWQIGEKKQVALKFMREHDGNDLNFSEEFKDLSDRRADLKEPVATFTHLLLLPNPVESEIRFNLERRCYYEYKWVTQTNTDPFTKKEYTVDVLGWKNISIGMQDGFYKFGRQEVEEIKSKWSTPDAFEAFPVVRQQGNMNGWRAPQQAFTPRLMIYDGNNYGSNQTAAFSFEYEKAEIGILPKFWKNWNPFWSNRLAVSGEFDFPVNALRHLIYNICNKYRTREGEFLIEEMNCELYIDRIGVTEIKGFKV